MDKTTKKQILFAALIVFLLFFFSSRSDTDPAESRLKINPVTAKKAAVVLHAVANELDRLADEGTENTDAYLVQRAQEAFDQHIKDIDLPGPDILSRKVARLAVKPTVTAIIRAVTPDETEK